MVVTRAAEQAGPLVQQLESLGAEVLLLPAVAFREPEDLEPCDRALRSLDTFDWVLFTSQNAVRFFCKRSRGIGIHWSGAAGRAPRVAAVGPATAEAARREGIQVSRTAKQFRGEQLARELAGEVAGKKVLLPRSDKARGTLPDALRAAGAEVVEVVAYSTGLPASGSNTAIHELRTGKADVVAFASPSAFHNLAEMLGLDSLMELSSRAILAAIGPATSTAIREAGFDVAVEAEEATAAGLAAAIANHFSNLQASGVSQS